MCSARSFAKAFAIAAGFLLLGDGSASAEFLSVRSRTFGTDGLLAVDCDAATSSDHVVIAVRVERFLQVAAWTFASSGCGMASPVEELSTARSLAIAEAAIRAPSSSLWQWLAAEGHRRTIPLQATGIFRPPRPFMA